MIRAIDIHKSFDGFAALDGTTLTVPQGAVYGLVGPNGAGKSTLLRCLTGIYRPDSGQVLLDGQPVWENPEVKARVAYIPDDLFYFMQADLRSMAKYYAGLYPRFDWDRFEKLRAAFPAIRPKATLRSLSKGMQKQAAFWLALCCRPDVVILDEPVDGLDPVMRRQVWSLLLGDAAEYGTTVLVSSHNLRELEDVCDHVGILHGGKVLLERSLSDLQGSTVKIQAVFDGDVTLPEGLDLLHRSNTGRMQTFVLRGDREDLLRRFTALSPVYLEALPLGLEEIFIYELGGADYGVHEILL
jgi:ABC-2 type transport system ATP-binding protein